MLLIVIAFIQLFISAQRAPIDLIEVEGEIVAGYNTEISGANVLVIYFTEYFHLFNAAIAFSLCIGNFNIYVDFISFIFCITPQINIDYIYIHVNFINFFMHIEYTITYVYVCTCYYLLFFEEYSHILTYIYLYLFIRYMQKNNSFILKIL